jgi:hypothetical protein
LGTQPRSRWEAGAGRKKLVWVSDSANCDLPILGTRKNDLAELLERSDSGILGKMGTYDGCTPKMDCPGLDWVHRKSQEWIIVIWS